MLVFDTTHTFTHERTIRFLSCVLHWDPIQAICRVSVASVPGGRSPPNAWCVPIVAVPASGVCGGEALLGVHSTDRDINEAHLLTTARTVTMSGFLMASVTKTFWTSKTTVQKKLINGRREVLGNGIQLRGAKCLLVSVNVS